MPHVSIVMPTHNKRQDSIRCAKEVLNQAARLGGCEYIVVDDGSSDGTSEALSQLDTLGVPFRYLRLPGRGPAVARNAGILESSGAIIVMIDDDALPQDGWLSTILRPFTSPRVAGVEGKVVPVGGEEWGPMGMSPRNLSGGVYLTCNCAYRREALMTVGCFDEGFPYPAFEDTDLAMQILRIGEIAWAPDAVAHHPRRRWSLKRALRELRFNEALTRFAVRYLCLGWSDRPTRFPRLRVFVSATTTLPIGRVLAGIRVFPMFPAEATRFISISLIQAMAALVIVPVAICQATRKSMERIRPSPL